MSQRESVAARDVSRRILIVDDEFDITTTYSMLLEINGFEVCIASNGAEALAMAAVKPPDIVVSDYMMPVMNGIELCLKWRDDPVTRHIPFILMSAGVFHDEINCPFDAFLRKPVRFEELLEQINKLTGYSAS